MTAAAGPPVGAPLFSLHGVALRFGKVQALHAGDEDVDHADHAEQHQAERERERQVALACLQRDGRGHHACEAVSYTHLTLPTTERV